MLDKILSKPIFRLSVVILVNENLLRSTPTLAKEIKHRNYARWSARKPSKTFFPDEILSKEEARPKDKQNYERFPAQQYDDRYTYQDKEPAYPDDTNYDYEVLGEHDFTFSKLMTQVSNRNMRRKNSLMMLEGKRLNFDALQAGLKPKKMFFTQKSFLEELEPYRKSKIPLFKIPYQTVKLWSKLETPPGVIGFYSIPREADITPVNTLPIKVLCDNVRDPGNLGAIIRVAASVGCTQLLLMKGCTDPWDSKVLRSASGGHFHIPISMDLSWSEHDTFLQPSDVIYLSDSTPANRKNDLPLQNYHQVNFQECSSVVVVVGGETEGLSKDVFKIAERSGGSRVYIPLSNCMESLNSGCALSVILFEIKRQFLLKDKMSENRTRDLNQPLHISSAIG